MTTYECLQLSQDSQRLTIKRLTIKGGFIYIE
jgi:hypothetical protein